MTLTAEEAVDFYVAAWNATDASAREDLIRRAFTDDAVMIGGHDIVRGPEAIAGFIETAQSAAPVTARRVSVVDSHGGWLRYEWKACDARGTVVAEGIDVAEQSDDGRLQRLIVFQPLGLPPSGESRSR